MQGNRLVRVVVVTAIIAGAAIGIAALIGLATGTLTSGGMKIARGVPIDERKRLPTTAIDLIAIETVSEDIRVLEGGGDTVEAWFHGTVNSSNPDAIPRLVAERRGSAIDIRLERKRRWNLGWHWGTLALEVTVPKGYAGKVSAKGVSAKIELADHAFGGLSLSTVSGEVSLGTVRTSDFEMHTTSGRFRAAGVMAERSELSSISGEMEVKSLSGILRAHSVSGEVSLGFVSTPAFADVTSTSGEVSLRLPANAGFQLDARSTSGQVTCDFPIQISESQSGGGRHALAGTVGGGTNSIKVRTVSGTIRVQR